MLHGSNVNPRMWLRKVLVKEMHAASHHQERASLGFIVPVDYLQARVAAVALTVSYNCINGAPTPSRSLCHLMSIIIVYIYINSVGKGFRWTIIITTVEAFGLWVFRIHNDEGGCIYVTMIWINLYMRVLVAVHFCETSPLQVNTGFQLYTTCCTTCYNRTPHRRNVFHCEVGDSIMVWRMWVFFGLFLLFANLCRLVLHSETCAVLAILQWSINKNQIGNRTSPYLGIATIRACLLIGELNS